MDDRGWNLEEDSSIKGYWGGECKDKGSGCAVWIYVTDGEEWLTVQNCATTGQGLRTLERSCCSQFPQISQELCRAQTEERFTAHRENSQCRREEDVSALWETEAQVWLDKRLVVRHVKAHVAAGSSQQVDGEGGSSTRKAPTPQVQSQKRGVDMDKARRAEWLASERQDAGENGEVKPQVCSAFPRRRRRAQ